MGSHQIPWIHIYDKDVDLPQTPQSWPDAWIYRLTGNQFVGVDKTWIKTKQTTSAFSLSRSSCVRLNAIVSEPPADRAFAMAFPIPAMIKVLCMFVYSAESSLASHSPLARHVHSNTISNYLGTFSHAANNGRMLFGQICPPMFLVM